MLSPHCIACPGSPASAGIDPSLCVIAVGLLRFPRIRGDRPQYDGKNLVLKLVPPHPRG